MDSDYKTKKSPASFERRPLMLKDYLSEETNSYSSTDFLCYPRRQDTTVRNLLEIDLNTRDTKNSRRLLRNRSKAASTTISAFQKASESVINAVRNLPFSPIRLSSSPTQRRSKQGILARSLSRRLRRRFWKKDEKENCETRVSIRVKDIIRWRSFGEVDFSSPITSSSSSRSSWSESDVASDFLPSSGGSSEYSGENELVVEGKKNSPEKKATKPKSTRGDVGGDSVETSTTTSCACVEPQGEENRVICSYEEKEQLSPISVLDFPDEDEETTTCFQHSLANVERTTQQLLQKIRRFEILSQLDPVDLDKIIASSNDEEEDEEEFSQLGERPKNLLQLLKSSTAGSRTWNADRLLVDLFREGLDGYQTCLSTHAEEESKESEEELLLTKARDWINGCGTKKWMVDDDREAYVSEMERRGKWMKFKEEESELAMEMEIAVLGPLIEELLFDLLTI